METTWLARQFVKQREIIEAAETPFAKLAVFVLPVFAPLVPAFLTSFHLHSLFIRIFIFSSSENISFVLSGIIGLVLELLGYVGAISFIKSLFEWIKHRTSQYLVPTALNGLAYLFYLVAMTLINFFLGKYLGEDGLVTLIVGLLSLITIPTGLLAANHLNESAEREMEEKDKTFQYEMEERLRQEKREERMERYRIKHGNFPESSRKVPEPVESSKKVPLDWRKVRPQLSSDDLRKLANLSPDNMRQYSSETGYTYKTISNWRMRARLELGLKEDE